MLFYSFYKFFLNFFLKIDSVCPEGWNLFDDVCIQINSEQKTFDEAKSTGCKNGVFWSQPYFGLWIQVNTIFLLKCFDEIVK